MKILIDMNLSPRWVSVLLAAGHEADHWSSIGEPDASDHQILAYAKSKGYIIFTHDLDFGTILASAKADCPSVIQIRSQNVAPEHLGILVLSALEQFKVHLEDGALVTVDENKSRARILPLNIRFGSAAKNHDSPSRT